MQDFDVEDGDNQDDHHEAPQSVNVLLQRTIQQFTLVSLGHKLASELVGVTEPQGLNPSYLSFKCPLSSCNLILKPYTCYKDFAEHTALYAA